MNCLTYTEEAGSAGVAFSRVYVAGQGATTALCGVNTSRRSLTVHNDGSDDLLVVATSNTGGLAAGAYFRVKPGAALSLSTCAALAAMCPTNTVAQVVEEYGAMSP